MKSPHRFFHTKTKSFDVVVRKRSVVRSGGKEVPDHTTAPQNDEANSYFPGILLSLNPSRLLFAMFTVSSDQASMDWYNRINDGDRILFSTPLLRGSDAMLSAADDDPEEPLLLRRLTETRGQAVLTFLYLCVLGLCFMTAVVYFCRMQFEERYLRRLRESELGAIRSALAQSETTQREESRAVQRKYIEERRARILQLLGPVRLVSMPQIVFQNFRPP